MKASLFLYCILLILPFRCLAYTNHNYLYSIDSPPGLTECAETPPAPNDGVAVLLHGDNCAKIDKSARIIVWAEYNVAYEAKSTTELLTKFCKSSERTEITVDSLRFQGCMSTSGASQPDFFAYVRLSPAVGPSDYINYYFKMVGKVHPDAEVKRLFLKTIRSFKLLQDKN